jgi:UrcA family protein
MRKPIVRRSKMMNSKTLVEVGRVCAAFAGATLLLGTVGLSRVTAGEVQVITVSSPRVKIVEHGPGTQTATEQITLTAHVPYDPVTLTTNSGVALLKDGVQEAARRVCRAADPGSPEDTSCIRKATDGAQKQIDTAVARARASARS